MILMTFKILKGLVGCGGAKYLIENLSLMEGEEKETGEWGGIKLAFIV